MHQHTGNWIGKTVETSKSRFYYKYNDYEIVDLPGTYTLSSASKEEEVARDFLKTSNPDCIVCVIDSTVLERSLLLVFQLMQLSSKIVVVLNLCDEAKKKGIFINEEKLSLLLGVPVVKATARSGKGINNLLEQIHLVATNAISPKPEISLSKGDRGYEKAKEIALSVLEKEQENKLGAFDRIMLGKYSSALAMLLLFGLVLYITISFSNYPSALLKQLFDSLEAKIAELLISLGTAEWAINLFVFGMLRVLFFVVSVMLPPMAIFFPLFSLLEDWGLFPRFAFNLDYPFEKCSSCGKQALCCCMGLGCNAVGVTGARIIDSPRERAIAIITNSLTPCNGRFPLLIAIISMFFAKSAALSSAILLAFLCLSLMFTMLSSKFLGKTLLRGMPSSYAMELPPYRKPRFFKTIINSIREKVVFVLLRAICVAAPAGVVIWGLANIKVGNISILNHMAGALDPIGRIMGMDGVILLAFILGFPANEIVLPIALMTYLSSGVLSDYSSLSQLSAVLVNNGWSAKTAICVCIFSLFHFPCATTLLTIYQETKSKKYALLSIILPLSIGFVLCTLINMMF
jgi:ferrous iron transport protein B